MGAAHRERAFAHPAGLSLLKPIYRKQRFAIMLINVHMISETPSPELVISGRREAARPLSGRNP
jgi:hypothetical protein